MLVFIFAYIGATSRYNGGKERSDIMTYEEAIEQLNNVVIYHEAKCTREALDIAIKCIEKQIPKETIEDGYNGGACACPSCGWAFAFDKESKAEIIKMNMYRYCPECGQAIEWSE